MKKSSTHCSQSQACGSCGREGNHKNGVQRRHWKRWSPCAGLEIALQRGDLPQLRRLTEYSSRLTRKYDDSNNPNDDEHSQNYRLHFNHTFDEVLERVASGRMLRQPSASFRRPNSWSSWTTQCSRSDGAGDLRDELRPGVDADAQGT